MGDRLRPLWDFDDLEGSRERFLAQLAEETTDAGRAAVLTQLARVEGLRDEFERCDELLDEAEALGGVTARLLLARGRDRGRVGRSRRPVLARAAVQQHRLDALRGGRSRRRSRGLRVGACRAR